MPAKFIQTVYTSLKQDMASLAAKRRKTGKRNGKLRFRSSYDSIELNQYGTPTGYASGHPAAINTGNIETPCISQG